MIHILYKHALSFEGRDYTGVSQDTKPKNIYVNIRNVFSLILLFQLFQPFLSYKWCK